MNLSQFIKQRLTESFIEEELIDEDYPSGWNIEEFAKLRTFADRQRYCETNLQRISSGSGRIAYKIDDQLCLKLAKNTKGVAQNEVEMEYGSERYYAGILGNTHNAHPEGFWVEMELAKNVSPKKFQQLAGIDINTLRTYLSHTNDEMNGRKSNWYLKPEVVEFCNDLEIAVAIMDFVQGTDAAVGDMGRLSSWGVVSRDGQETLVLIDYGLSNGVYQTHYSPKPNNIQYYR